jgi:PKD repeat protein
MKRTLFFFVSIIALILANPAAYSQKSQESRTVVLTPTSFNVSIPLRDLARMHPYVEKRERWESPDRENRPHQTFLYSSADGPQYGTDLSACQTTMGTRDISNRAPIKNWAGQVYSLGRPMDPTGAVDDQYYVQAINATPFTVYNKTTGASVLTANIGSLWSPAVGNAGDPIVMYDKFADRWFLSQFGTSSDKKIYIAISTTSDPTGSYYCYTYTSSEFPDYLKFSIWGNGYYMTSNQTTDKVFCFERDQMLIGNSSARSISATFTTGSVSAFFVPLPADASDNLSLPASNTVMPFFAYYDNGWGGGTDGVKIWNMTVDWSVPSATIAAATQVNTAAFDASYNASWNDVAQPGTTQKLDGIGGVPTFRAQWRSWSGYNTVVLNWGVLYNSTTGQRSIKWVELRQDQSTGTWSLYQEGTYVPDAANRWLGSIAMDNNGSIALAYAKSSSSIYPGLYYTGRLASDPLGTMTFAETEAIAGTSSQTSTNRYGDYSHTSLDPDGVTFWHTGEYISSGVKTRIFSFQLPAGPLSPVANFSADATAPVCSSTVQFTDMSTNSPTSWLWNFGDGQTSTLQNPSHTYAANGTYTVSLQATNAIGNNTMTKTSYITINMSIAPTATGASRCGTGTVTLTASGNNVIHWYDAASGGNELGTGSSFTTPSISSTTTYYAENVIPSASQYVGPVAAGAANTTASYLTFDCYTPVILVSVAVNAGTAGAKTIELRDNAGTLLKTTTVTVAAGASRVTLNWNIPAGTGLRLGATANSNLFRKTTGVSFPYTLSGLVSITGCSAGTTRYTFFFDWEVQLPGCSSGRVPCIATVNPAVTPAVSISPSASTICAGTNVTFTATPTNGGTPAYQWKLNGTNTGSNSATYSNSSLAQGDVVSCVMTSTASCATPTTATSNNVSMTVNSAVTPAVSIAASSSNICSGTNVTFTATPVNGGTPTYQWKLNGTNTGSNSATYSNSSLAQGDVVSCVMTSTANCASPLNANSNNITMTVSSPVTPAVSIVPSATNICSGTNVTFTANPVNGGTPTYQWKLNGTNTGTNSATYSNSSLVQGDVVSCVMTSTATCATPATATSNNVSMTVSSSVTPAVSIAASASTICAGSNVTFTATPSNGGTPSYQWKLNGTNTGSNSATYSSSSLAQGDVVTCTMTSSVSCANPLTAGSNSITMTVNSIVVPSVSIVPTATTICAGTAVSFTASPVNGGTPVYQWQVNGSNAGTNSASFSSSSLANSDVVRCIMTSNANCASPVTATSNSVNMTVNPSLTPAVSIGASATTICAGTNVTFTATPTNGGTPSYQWKLNGSNAGTNSPTYSNASLANGDVVSCVMTSTAACASAPTATSSGISMIVNSTVTPTLIISSNPAGPVCPGTTKVFTPVPGNGGTSPVYNWTVDGTVVYTGSSFSGVFNDGQVISCTMTSNANCASPTTADAMPITISTYTVSPVTVNESMGTLTSSAASGNQWYEQTTGLIAGMTSPTYTPGSNGNYYTVVTDGNGCTATSNTINMTSVSIPETSSDPMISMSPNPTHGLMEISFAKTVSNAKLFIENELGQRVFEKVINQSSNTRYSVDFSKYASGIYFVVIKAENTNLKQKVVYEK